MEDEVERAVEILDARTELIDDGHRKSITFFGGRPLSDEEIVGCDYPVTISDDLSPRSPNPEYPQLGSSTDKTSIGQALEAVMVENPNPAAIVLITDGTEECNSDFLSFRTRHPHVNIEVYQLGDNPNAALQLLEIIPISQPTGQAILAPQNPISVALIPTEEIQEAGWLARMIWMLVLAFSAGSAILFCLQSGERGKDLRDQLVGLDEKTPSDLEVIYTSHVTVKNKQKRVPDHKRFKIFWFKNRNGHVLPSYGLWGCLSLLIASVGLVGLTFPELAVLLLDAKFVTEIRDDCWSFLNSNIGAVSFAGTVLTLAGFSAFQWWQTFDAKKELLINSGTIKSERQAANRKTYERKQSSILNDQFSAPKIKTGWFAGVEIDFQGFEPLQKILRDFAAPPFEKASQRQRRDIDRYVRVRDMLTFASLLHEVDALELKHVESLARIFESARNRDIETAEAEAVTLIQVLTEASAG
ncbi:MAG: hypothetical protein ACX94B_15605 [Henriciella sp.]